MILECLTEAETKRGKLCKAKRTKNGVKSEAEAPSTINNSIVRDKIYLFSYYYLPPECFTMI